MSKWDKAVKWIDTHRPPWWLPLPIAICSLVLSCIDIYLNIKRWLELIILGLIAILFLVLAPVCASIGLWIADHSSTMKQARKSYIFRDLSYFYLIIGEVLAVVCIYLYLSQISWNISLTQFSKISSDSVVLHWFFIAKFPKSIRVFRNFISLQIIAKRIADIWNSAAFVALLWMNNSWYFNVNSLNTSANSLCLKSSFFILSMCRLFIIATMIGEIIPHKAKVETIVNDKSIFIKPPPFNNILPLDRGAIKKQIKKGAFQNGWEKISIGKH